MSILHQKHNCYSKGTIKLLRTKIKRFQLNLLFWPIFMKNSITLGEMQTQAKNPSVPLLRTDFEISWSFIWPLTIFSIQTLSKRCHAQTKLLLHHLRYSLF